MAEQDDDQPVEQYEEWQSRYETGEEDAKQMFSQISNIAVCLSYDLIDKLRWWEKETLKQPDEEIDKRLEHMSLFLDQLKTAYVTFSEVDF